MQKENTEKTFAFLVDNGEESKQSEASYRQIQDVENLEVGENVIGSVFMDMYIFHDEFIGSQLQKEIQKDMDADKSYSVLVLNVNSTLSLETVENLLFTVLTEEGKTFGSYEFEIEVTGVYAFKTDSR